jgi:hypothetical protein
VAWGQADADVLSSGSTLAINGVDVLTLKTSAGGLAPAERAAVVAKALGGFKRGQTVKVVADPALRIALQDQTVVTITEAEAKAQKLDVNALAENWCRGINKALYIPPLAVNLTSVDLILGKANAVRVLGSQSRQASVRVEPTDLVEVERRGFDLMVTPKKLGEGQIILSLGTTTKSIPFTVSAYAANFPQSFSVEVTGNPASKDLVLEAIRGAMSTRFEAQPRARVEFDVPAVTAVKPGEMQVFQVMARVVAPGFAENSGVVSVAVKNVGGGRVFEDFLWYSNEPENLKGAGQLYYARLTTDSPARLLWHHCNKAMTPLVVQYVLANRSNREARVWVISGDAEPNADPTKAGFQAGSSFFQSWLGYQGSVVTIPARSVVPIVLRRITAEETSSGLASLRLMPGSGEDVALVGNALWPLEVAGEWQAQPMQGKPWLVRRSISFESFVLPVVGKQKHIYERPAKQVGFLYQVGGRLGFVRIGQESILSAIGESPLSGNFGVHYVIDGRIENPTNKAQVVEGVFEASAGYSGAIFTVDGKLLPGKVLQSKETMRLFEFNLAPGQSREVRVETVPLSGAHYPATITVRTKGRS